MILASNSPRRKQLLQEAGYEFKSASLQIEEDYPLDIALEEVAKYLAEKKNDAYRTLFKDEVIVTADTTVICGQMLLEKASTTKAATEMLKSLSGNMHQVISGVCVSKGSKLRSFSVTTDVHFANLSAEEIDYYISKFSPFDKAGAYGIQEWIGMIGIQKIVGSYYNVVGIPLFELYRVLKEDFGVIPR
ncbi:MAG: Maf family protein [Crocinitomicaceae bacterium]